MTSRSNEELALSLLADATSETARDAGQQIRNTRAEEARRAVRQAAEGRSDGDLLAGMASAALAVTVLGPFLIGHFLMTHTFVLKPDRGVYDGSARGITDHFWATYLAGLIPIALLLGIFLVARTPWRGRTTAVIGGWIAVLGALVILLPIATSQWGHAEQKTIKNLRETAYPFSDKWFNCESWNIHAENGVHDPELWQIHLGQVKGTPGRACNRVDIYRGWQRVRYYELPDGDFFTGEIIVNHFDWSEPYRNDSGGDIASRNSRTGKQVPMNPAGTNVELLTTNGQTLEFTLDPTKGEFHMK